MATAAQLAARKKFVAMIKVKKGKKSSTAKLAKKTAKKKK